jgi:hypothetical protein
MPIIARCLGKNANRKTLKPGRNVQYPGIGIATVALIDSTVSVTTKHSDSVPIASEVAMALVSREDATGAGRLSKPAAPGDRTMSKSFRTRSNHPATPGNVTMPAGNIAAVSHQKWRNRGKG